MAEKKRGRPVKASSKKYRLEIRMGSEDKDILDELVVSTGIGRAKIMLAALRLYYAMRLGK